MDFLNHSHWSFSEDFRLTACQSIIRHVMEKYGGRSSPERIAEEEEPPGDDKQGDMVDVDKDGDKKKEESGTSSAPSTPCMNSDCTRSRPGSMQANPCASSSNSLEGTEVLDEKEKVAQELSELYDAATDLFNQSKTLTPVFSSCVTLLVLSLEKSNHMQKLMYMKS
jgi:hypothetical protein